jgi:hypothetical protein
MEKKEKEDAVLSQLMMDLDLFDDFRKFNREHGRFTHPVPAEDELMTGLRKLKKEGTSAFGWYLLRECSWMRRTFSGKESREAYKTSEKQPTTSILLVSQGDTGTACSKSIR